ncbi:hypothetical protein [Pseudomonas sp. NPDC079086]|uniref:hypothetical protein n=1 Tax=unclassified Pseudomonas TaxID=196821 RepID=UPI0037C9B908
MSQSKLIEKWKSMKKTLTALILAVLPLSVLAKDQIIDDGFKAFKEKGVAEAWKSWAKDGPLEGSKELQAQSAQFGQITAYYGNFISHEYVSEKEISPSTKSVYVVINMEKGPLFGRFMVYKKSNGQLIIPSFNFHTFAEQVWPPCVYSECGN